jgi:hypothetical protein
MDGEESEILKMTVFLDIIACSIFEVALMMEAVCTSEMLVCAVQCPRNLSSSRTDTVCTSEPDNLCCTAERVTNMRNKLLVQNYCDSRGIHILGPPFILDRFV